jgi:hypothetical protein
MPEVELQPNLHMHSEYWPENGTKQCNLVEVTPPFRKVWSLSSLLTSKMKLNVELRAIKYAGSHDGHCSQITSAFLFNLFRSF